MSGRNRKRYQKSKRRLRLVQSILAGAIAIGGAYFAYRGSESAPVTLETVAANENFRVFERREFDIGEDVLLKVKFERKYPDAAEKSEGTMAICSKEVSLLPNTPEFRNLTERLNDEIQRFEEKYLDGTKPHRLKLVTGEDDLETLPYETEQEVRMYFVNKINSKEAFWTIVGNELKYNEFSEESFGEADRIGIINLDKKGVTITSRPKRIIICPDLERSAAERYALLVNTIIAERIHSYISKDSEELIEKSLRAKYQKSKCLTANNEAVVFNLVQDMEEGLVHAVSLLYLQERFPEAVRRKLEWYSTQERYRLVKEFYMKKKPQEDRVKTLLNAFKKADVKIK